MPDTSQQVFILFKSIVGICSTNYVGDVVYLRFFRESAIPRIRESFENVDIFYFLVIFITMLGYILIKHPDGGRIKYHPDINI